MLKQNIRLIFKIFSVALIVIVIALPLWLFRLNSQIQTRLTAGWFRPPVEIYSRGEQLRIGQLISRQKLRSTLADLRYRERHEDQTLLPHDFAELDAQQCSAVLNDSDFVTSTDVCFYLQTPENIFGPTRQPETVLLVLKTQETKELLAKIIVDQGEQNVFEFSPQLFAQFYDGEPILRSVINVGDAPIECLQAVTAIEDSQFLEHKGISFTGLARAMIRNLITGRYAQGGSTITQQLVKNYFLTAEKTLKRKFVELAMALLLELNSNKDQILENYLNVAYMGQRGPFQVIGLGAASEHYFNKPLANLNLPECALLAAIINSPRRFNPYANPENALHRRDFVIDRMVETNMITAAKGAEAKASALPKTQELRLIEPAPYFTQAIFRELKRLSISTEAGVRVFSTLDVNAQDLAQKKVREHVEALEKNNKAAIKNKDLGKQLEASLISVDVETGEVIALVGGRQYSKTQYNRILDAHRQIGSIMKPFVFLAALENRDENGDAYHALSLVEDSKFTHRYEGQSWSPQNYSKEFFGVVPLFYALKNSLNSATAKLSLQVGLNNVIDVARRAGFTSELTALPSLSLGAFEIYPWEVATGYLTLARFGNHIDLTYIRTIEDLAGEVIFASDMATGEVVFAPETVAVLIGMMKQTLLTGTARIAHALGFYSSAAGKTGTTSDLKDTWFAGFTPETLTITWTGYDDNTPTGLTGASGALPLWASYMKELSAQFLNHDFLWPDTVEKFEVSADELKKLVTKPEPHEVIAPTELIRIK